MRHGSLVVENISAAPPTVVRKGARLKRIRETEPYHPASVVG